MPTYQYACTDCEHAFEQFQSFSDDALTVCPECSGKLRKLFNAVGVVFKGSGFYRNDSRGKSTAGETPSEKPSDRSRARHVRAGRLHHLVLRLLLELERLHQHLVGRLADRLVEQHPASHSRLTCA